MFTLVSPLGRVDPYGCGRRSRLRRAPHEALRMYRVSRREDGAAPIEHRCGGPVMHRYRGEQCQARVVMLVVVPVEERDAKRACVLEAAKALGKLRPVFERLELRLREWVVVAHVGSGV